MATIVYPIHLVGDTYTSPLQVPNGPTMTSEAFKTVSPIDILSFEDRPQHLDNGWERNQEFTVQGPSINAINTSIILDGARLVPTLTGPVVTASSDVRVDSGDYELGLGTEPVLGVKSAGRGALARAFIFKRKGGKVEIEQEFQYTHIDSIKDRILDTQFTEIQNDGQDFFAFSIHDPIPVSRYHGSNLEADQVEYLSASFSYEAFATSKGLSGTNFLESCDFVSLDSVRVTEWDFEDYGITIGTQYFPIHRHVAVMARYIDDATLVRTIYQIGNSSFGDIDAISGTISISGDFTSSVSLGRLEGFYLFYGVVPAVYIAPEDPVILQQDILDDTAELSYMSINTRDDFGNLVISEPILHLANNEVPEAESTRVIVPLRHTNFFLEPGSNIVIDGTLIRAGKKHWRDNEGTNSVEFKAPVNVLDMLAPSLLVNGTIETQSPFASSQIASDVAAVYGVFKHGDTLRASLAAAVSFQTSSLDTLVTSAQGYGESGYGEGGYGQGKLLSHGSTVYYTTGGQPVVPDNTKLSLMIKPIDIGYELVLPAWAQKDTIEVVEITERSATPFPHWSFINPDILIFNKEKVHDQTTYSITFDVSVYPIIQGINLNNNTLNLSVISDPVALYPEFLGYYLLHSKDIEVRIGYLDEAGTTRYFPKTIDISLAMGIEYLQRVITGTKTLIF